MSTITPPRAPGRSFTPPPAPSKLRETIGMLAVTLVFALAVVLADANWPRLLEAPAVLGEFVVLMTQGVLQNPLEAPTNEYWTRSLELMIESLHIAWIGTLIGAILSFPLGFLAARNVAPPGVVVVVRQILNAIRAIPEIIFAIAIMLPIFGLGPLAGALAIGVNSVGTLGKLTSEAIESIDTGPVESARASGASRWQVIRYAMVPQVMPEVVAYWLYRFEINIRASAILGVLGAGGIGSILSALFNIRAWDRIGVTLAVIIIVTLIIDAISGSIRHRIIHGAAPRGVRRRRALTPEPPPV
ncbi:phosphonate transport system permease protein [Microcella alkaliphila]|uniref:Phosphonate transport system permease protein n=1 Tax=Microcella alkaliphila TaxID=279828 RepID=A0A4Q7TW14_9MICO|nr:phosphonate ABC transporter, permease protein PhnE [Microcella alkaliphila]RZT64188.1 phosphonate transport system permease protein [Microcella alkaliphila]